jgi:phosphate transport system ATP-binding protein
MHKKNKLVKKIDVIDLNFYYHKFHALKNINLSIAENKVTAFIGHSGSGKSTLIRTLNRIYALYPQHKAVGKIMLDGTNILSPLQDVILLRKKVGMVFQAPTPFPMTIKENITFGVKLYEWLNKADMHDRVESSLKQAALWNEVKDKLDAPSSALSQGQQQRLCIARAIAVQPEVILFDEPTASLDPKSSALIEQLILELKQNYTIVIVTHNLKQAIKVSDFTAHIFEGELITFDATKNFFENPQNEITQEYIEEN